jgi:cytidylate kinase
VRRDARDEAQTQRAPDAILMDTTFLTQEEQVMRIVALARACLR